MTIYHIVLFEFKSDLTKEQIQEVRHHGAATVAAADR